MKVKLTNAELLALRDIMQLTCEKYGNIIATLHEDKRKLVFALPQDNSAFDTEINECQLSRAIFEEVWMHLQSLAFKRKPKYKITLRPVWAFAIRLEFNGIMDVTTQAGNMLQRMCNEIHQFYS